MGCGVFVVVAVVVVVVMMMFRCSANVVSPLPRQPARLEWRRRWVAVGGGGQGYPCSSCFLFILVFVR